MHTRFYFGPADAAGGAGTRALTGAPRRMLERIVDGIQACADYYAATAMYEQLSRLSDAELRRRGLSRESLARDVCAACDRSEHRR